jgi:hypothetical protein
MALPRWARSLTPEYITEPVHFAAGQTYEDKFYICDPTFVHDSSVAAAAAGDGDGYTLRRVVIDSGLRHWQSRWNTGPTLGGDNDPGVRSTCGGFTSQGPSGITLEGVRIVGFPQKGMLMWGCSGSTFTDIDVSLCNYGADFKGRTGFIENTNVTRLHVRDQWGPDTGNWDDTAYFESQARPGESTGRDGIIGDFMHHCVFTECSAVGETGVGAGKFANNLRDFTMVDCVFGNHQFQGSDGPDSTNTTSRDITMVNCTIDKGNGYGVSAFNQNGLQLSWNIDNFRMLGGMIRCGGNNGHGVQIAEPNVDAFFEGVTFTGFNGFRCSGQTVTCGNPAYAVNRNEGTFLNGGGTEGDEDFVARNIFVNQERKVLVS